MNRSISLHPLSLVVGIGFGVLALLSMSQMPALNARGVNIEYVPHPRDMVVIKGGAPYTVPEGKIFVLTGLGATQSATTRLIVNNVPEVTCFTVSGSDFCTIFPVTTGFTLHSGSIFTMDAVSYTHLTLPTILRV